MKARLGDKKFQRTVEKAHKEIKKGKFGTLDTLYRIHRETIEREASLQ